jgi:hypothetical protein
VLCEHGVKIAPNSYYAHKKRKRSGRLVRDEAMLTEIVRVHTNPMTVGAVWVRKVHAAIGRLGRGRRNARVSAAGRAADADCGDPKGAARPPVHHDASGSDRDQAPGRRRVQS